MLRNFCFHSGKQESTSASVRIQSILLISYTLWLLGDIFPFFQRGCSRNSGESGDGLILCEKLKVAQCLPILVIFMLVLCPVILHIERKRKVFLHVLAHQITYNHKLTIPDKFAKERNYIQKKDSVKTKD